MGQNQVPRGTTKKEQCKCGTYYSPKVFGSKMKLTDACAVCSPHLYKEEKKKK